jgi:hypothetical protein
MAKDHGRVLGRRVVATVVAAECTRAQQLGISLQATHRRSYPDPVEGSSTTLSADDPSDHPSPSAAVVQARLTGQRNNGNSIVPNREIVPVPAGSHHDQIESQVTRVLRNLAHLESLARRAQPDASSRLSWPPVALDTGLTSDQQSFIAHLAPAAVLDLCYAQREMIGLLLSWAEAHPDPADREFVLGVVSAFSNRTESPQVRDRTATDSAAGALPKARDWPGDEEAVSVALLDRNGVIVAVNQVWTDFCLANGGRIDACGPGSSYIEACNQGGDDTSAAVARAIEDAVAGRAMRAYSITIPCHSPTMERWYDVLVSSRLSVDADTICGATVVLAPTGAPSSPLGGSTAPADHADLAVALHREVTAQVYRSTLNICSVLDRVTDQVAFDNIHRGVSSLDDALIRLRNIAIELDPDYIPRPAEKA